MRRLLILGANWPEALAARFKALLGDWQVIRHAIATEAQFREASVLAPTNQRVDRPLVEGSAIRLIHQVGIGVDNVDPEAIKDGGVGCGRGGLSCAILHTFAGPARIISRKAHGIGACQLI